ncbi:MAG: hypothetical protein RIS29_1579 [Bacteroidota bacterium]|jgi:UDP-N-acetylmuramate dehydrogenase
MKITEQASLLPFNTFNIDAKAAYLIEYATVEELQEVLNLKVVTENKLLHVGSGSNLLFMADYDGVVLHSDIQFIQQVNETAEHVFVETGGGVVWDDFVAWCVEKGFGGVENLSLIPGEVGASAVQNIGAYGVEVKDVIETVYAVEIATGRTRVFSNADCRYGYRESIFKGELKGQYIVSSVTFRLDKQPVFKLGYQHLEDEVRKNGDLSLENIRQTIIAVRESKLPDPKVLGNAGSFFMNPVVPKNQYLELQEQYPQMPHYYVSETEEKIPAGWLIDQCGWKGKCVGNAGVHKNQALVLVNTGGATGAEIVHLAEEIQKTVNEKFGILLHPEVNYIS